MRATALGLQGTAGDFRGDTAGPVVIAGASGVAGLATSSACIEVGGALREQARSLGDDVGGYAEKLNAAAERYERGDYEAAESIAFERPEESARGSADTPVGEYERQLREAGLLTGPLDGYFRQWLENASRRAVPPETVVDIAGTNGITQADFAVLNGLQQVNDRDGKSFFIMPSGTGAAEMKKAAVMTYILNAGTDYGDASPDNDFAEAPYSAAEVRRIIDRQNANSWSYEALEKAGRGAAFATTPNAMLMGLGGPVTDVIGVKGGTTYGDLFAMNIDGSLDPNQVLRETIRSGNAWYQGDDGRPFRGTLDLDRLLHHEERHSQQWAEKGFAQMAKDYGLSWMIEQVNGTNPLERDSGLADGGYK